MWIKDEYLEKLWVMQELGKTDLESLALGLEEGFDPDILHELIDENLIEVSDNGRSVVLTEKGGERSRHIIRAHRIGERLLFDIFGGNFERGACEFEHIVSVELVNGLCTLLGHPRKCPHGNLIPEGECCRNVERTAQNAVSLLGDMEIGQRARVAYIDCDSSKNLFKFNGFQIRPGVEIVLQQRYPCIVVDCEGSCIALDDVLASSIRVWTKGKRNRKLDEPTAHKRKLSRLRRLGLKLGWK